MAQRNIDRYHATGKLDPYYLESLGPDAAPTILAGLPTDLATCITADQPDVRDDDVLSWNLGRSRAAGLGVGGGQDRGVDCGAVFAELEARG